MFLPLSTCLGRIYAASSAVPPTLLLRPRDQTASEGDATGIFVLAVIGVELDEGVEVLTGSPTPATPRFLS